jgi:hypothetical protein
MHDDLPQASRASLWIPVCGIAALCLAGGIPLLLRRHEPAALWIGGAYLTFCLILLYQALSGRRVAFSHEGVRNHGLLKTTYIPLSEASVRQRGTLVEIYSKTDRIRIGPSVDVTPGS